MEIEQPPTSGTNLKGVKSDLHSSDRAETSSVHSLAALKLEVHSKPEDGRREQAQWKGDRVKEGSRNMPMNTRRTTQKGETKNLENLRKRVEDLELKQKFQPYDYDSKGAKTTIPASPPAGTYYIPNLKGQLEIMFKKEEKLLPTYSGFMALEEETLLIRPCWPYEEPSNITWVQPVPEKDSKVTKPPGQITIKYVFDSKIKAEELRYSVPLYRGIKKNPKEDDKERFIWTGARDNKGNFRLGVYIRAEDLKMRVEGPCTTYYQQDIDRVKAAQRPEDDVENLPGAKKKTEGISEGHELPFPAWGRLGNVIQSNSLSAKSLFLSFSFTMDKIGDHRYWFFKYCQIVEAAVYTEREPWAILARFWDEAPPKLGQANEPTLIFRVQKDFQEYFQGFLDLLLPAKIDNQEKKGDELLQELKNGLKFKPKTLVKEWGEKIFHNDEKYTCIGGHPHGIYETWIETANLNIHMESSVKKTLKVVTDPNQTQLDKLDKLDKMISAGEGKLHVSETSTLITAAKVNIARTHPRIRSQQKVMGDVSATEVAKVVFDGSDTTGAAEWLHRSAYSFGGLGDGTRPDSSQEKTNLVFGTTEANTAMIRAENYLKRLAAYGLPIRLETQLLGVAPRPWFADKLKYEFKVDISGLKDDTKSDKAKLINGFVTGRENSKPGFKIMEFPLLEFRTPTKLEVMLDGLVTDKILEPKKPEMPVV